MKKRKTINEFVEGLEMTILPTEEQILLQTGGWGISGNNTGSCTNNCNGGNCASGCGG